MLWVCLTWKNGGDEGAQCSSTTLKVQEVIREENAVGALQVAHKQSRFLITGFQSVSCVLLLNSLYSICQVTHPMTGIYIASKWLKRHILRNLTDMPLI